jgi:hypothetical protein
LSFATPSGGKVLQVIQTTTTSSTAFTTTSFVAATGLSVSITPSSASNKVYVISSYTSEMSAGGRGFFTIFRDSTNVVADGLLLTQVENLNNPVTVQFLDSPATTSAISYTVRGRVQTGGQTLNTGGGTLVIIAMEISA